MPPFLSFRTFQIKGPFGLQFSFKTAVPGTLSIDYPKTNPESSLTVTDQSPIAQPPSLSYNHLTMDIPAPKVSYAFHVTTSYQY